MSFSTESHDLEFNPTFSTTVTLSAEATHWAIQICQQAADSEQQWSTFLIAMALRGLQQWLAEGAFFPSLSFDANHPPGQGLNCRVGGFRLCLLAQGGGSDELVPIPEATLDDEDNFAHLYILAEVHEEYDRVDILGGLRRDRLLAYKQQTHMPLNSDHNYMVPLSCFDTPPEDVLLYLNCLNPDMLAASDELSTAGKSQILKLGTGVAVNAGRWLQNQLDAVAETLHWTLMPPLAPNHALMSISTPEDELEAVLRDLDARGVNIPPMARGPFIDLQQQGLPCRLFIQTWTLVESETPEWSLFLILGPIPGQHLPVGTRLRLKDATSTLAAPTLEEGSSSTYLYAQGIGNWEEQFTATIEFPNGIWVELPPFSFDLEI
jgi:hypothetical protein